MNTSKITDEWQEALINQPDFLKQAMQIFLQKAMDEEFRKFIGADEYLRPAERKDYRNGTYTVATLWLNSLLN